MAIKVGLEPVIDEQSRILILGSLPGDESIRLQRYYADPKNQFWKILADVHGESISDDYVDRLGLLRVRGWALWDVLRSAERTGSLDKAINNPVPNAFHELFATYTGLGAIGFNGGTALTLFHRYVEKQLSFRRGSLKLSVLPSTSSAPGLHVLPYGEKVSRWRAFLTP